jgi:hypothetical protein
MAYTFNTNQTPATCAEAVYNLKTLLKLVGWTVKKSSDGTTYNSTGDQISSGASGANGMNNARAWFVIQEPGTVPRQFCLQRQNTVGVNTSYQWRVKYSRYAGFTGGSPAATVTPSATDEQILLGAGTDASPTFAALFATSTDGGLRHNLVANYADGYEFASFAWVNTSAIPTHGFFLDPLTDPAAADGYALSIYINGVISASVNGGVAGAGAFQYESICRNYSKMFGYKANGSWSSTIVGCTLACSNAGTIKLMSPYGMNINADNEDDVFKIPVVHLDTGTNRGDWRGFSTLMRWSSVIRASTSTLSTTGSKDRIILCDVSLPWDGSIPTV